jgi:hypothetical protein
MFIKYQNLKTEASEEPPRNSSTRWNGATPVTREEIA